MWFRKTTRSRRRFYRSYYKPMLERLEDRVVPTASWNTFGGNAQHTDVAQVAAQPIDQLLWQVPLDLAPWGSVHYGDPVFTNNNVVIVPIKVTWDANNQGATNFIEVGINDVTGAVLWSTAPIGSITGASNGSNDIVITTNNTNGLADGDYVTIGDMQGDTAANTGSSNKTYMISSVTATSFTLDNVTGNGAYTGGGLWVLSTSSSSATSYIEPHYGWLPPDQAAYDPVTDRVYFPGPGGTIDYISNPDTATGVVTPTQVAFYGTSNYTANPSVYNSSIFINTPVTVDNSGNVYFGYTVTGSNLSKITDGGIARISSTGACAYQNAYSAVGQSNDKNWNPALGSAPALSNDGSILYLGITDSGYGLNGSGEYNSYLVGLNSTTLAPEYSVRLYDPTSGSGVPTNGAPQSSGNGAGLIDQSTASPMVAPDGSVFLGVFDSNYDGSRGSLLHFSGDLSTEYAPGAFGWDDTPSIIPVSMVPTTIYNGSSSYLILSKYNNYANAEVGEPNGGSGINEIAVLDPNATQPDPNYDPEPNGVPMPVMKQIMTFASPSPDIPNVNAGDPDAVREWCTNGTAVDPAADSIYVNNEDGYTYQWNLGTNTITNTVEVSKGYGVPYTPTAISPNGEIFSDNGGTLFALGGYSNYTINAVSSATPAVYGSPITLTTTLASTSGGPTPSGTVTYTAYAGANNPLNYNTTPIRLGSATVVNGVASLTLPATELLSAHYHVTASYSGDSNYSAGVTTFSLPVLETATTSVTSSANPVANGTSVTFTATISANGTPSTVVQNGTGSSSYWVPTGTVTFMDGSTALGSVTLNPLENGTYPSSYVQQVTFTTSSLPLGTNAITAVYSGDQNFASGTSKVFDETVGGTSTAVSALPTSSVYGQSITLTATVTADAAGSGTPTGTVTFTTGTITLGKGALDSSGQASIQTAALPVGSDTITASYSGDSNFSASSGTTSETVGQNVAAYNFAQGSGNVLADVSGNGNYGTITNATWTTVNNSNLPFTSALQFSGGNNSLVTIADSPSLELTTGMTLEAWVDPTAPANGWQDAIYKARDNYYLEAASPSGAPAAGGTAGSTDTTLFGASPLPTNTWSFLTETYNDSSLVFYVNGVQVASAARSGSLTTSSNPLQLGGDSTYGQYFQGLISNVRIYNTALTAAQIQSDMTTPIATGPSPTVTAVTPANNASNVSTSSSVTVQFSEALDPATVTSSTIQLLTSSGSAVAASVSYNSSTDTVTLTPNSALSQGSTYTVLVHGGSSGAVVESAADVPLAANFSSSFTTAATPVAAYNFAQGSGNVLADVSGNGNNGTISNATWTTVNNSTLPFTGALQFTGGNNSLVTIANSASLDLTTGMTLEAWVDPTAAANGWQDALYKARDNYYLEAASPSGAPAAGGTPGVDTTLFGASPLPTNAWSFLSETYDGTNMIFYVNGVEVASVARSGSLTTSSNPLQLGGDSTYGQYFQGLISNVRIYNTALTAAQIQSDMTTPITTGPSPTVTAVTPANNASNASTSSSVTVQFSEALDPATVTSSTIQLLTSSGSAVAASVSYNSSTDAATLTPNAALAAGSTYSVLVHGGSSGAVVESAADVPLAANFSSSFTTAATPVAAYNFAQGSGNVLADVSGNGNNGTISNATWTTVNNSNLPFTGALQFTGGNNSLVTIANSASLDLTTGMTLEAWVDPTAAANGWQDALYKARDNYYLEAASPSGAPAAGGTPGVDTTLFGASPLPTNAWSFLSETYDGTNMIFYVNGVEVASVARSGSLTTSSNPLQIGGDSTYGQYFQGLISDVRIYNVALTATQIQSDMTTPIT